MYEILEIFYGPDATRAFVTTEGYEPYNLTDGDDFTVFLDERKSVQVIFKAAEFSGIGQAKAIEVAASITRQLRAQKSKGYAIAYLDPESNTNRVRIYSPSLGLGSSVRITNGKAQNILKFPDLLETNGALAGVQTAQNWAVTQPVPGTMRLTLAAASTTDLSRVQVGDYINIYGTNFATGNRGSFSITAIDVRYVAGILTQYIEVLNPAVFPQGSVAIALGTDLLFFHPTKATINGPRTVVVAQTTPNRTDIVLPATTTAVRRHKTSGAYLHQRLQLSPTAITRFGGTALVDFAAPHGLLNGEWVFLDNIYPTNTLPALNAGNGTSTTDASRVSPWSVLANGTNGSYSCAGTVIGNKAYIVGGFQLPAATAQAALSIFAITGSSVLADGSTRYTYTNTAGTVMPVARSNHRVVNMVDAFNTGRFISTGGVNTAGTAQIDSYIYDPVGNAWAGPFNMVVARAYHGLSALLTGNLLLTGGRTGAATWISSTEIFTPSGVGAGAFTAGPAMLNVRLGHNQVTLSDGRVLVAGGSQSATSLLATCEIYNPSTNAFTRTGDMAYSRQGAVIVLLPNDRVMMLGGVGSPVNQPLASGNSVLASAEIWDPRTGRWQPAGSMMTARSAFQAFYMPTLNKVIVFGGGAKTELFDVGTGKWSRAPRTDALVEATSFGFGGLLANGAVLMANGFNGSTSVATQRLWVPQSLTLGSGGLSGRHLQITSVPGPNQLTVATPNFPDAFINAAPTPALTPATAKPDTSFPGPFVYTPNEGVGITGIATTTTVALNQGGQYASLKVTDASNFPDGGGYLSLAFGTKLQVQPLRFLGKISATELILDFSTKMPVSLPIGATVTLLVSKGPYVPTNPEDVGSFYLTASSAGRVAASKMIDEVLASGFEVDKTIQYPGDNGLGGEGLPSEGAQKLSDKVGIWAGDEVDAEVEESRAGV
jgi:hypothetical protein